MVVPGFDAKRLSRQFVESTFVFLEPHELLLKAETGRMDDLELNVKPNGDAIVDRCDKGVPRGISRRVYAWTQDVDNS